MEDPSMAQSNPDPEEASNSLLRNTRCCFCFPCFGSARSSSVRLAWWERIGSSSDRHHEGRWWDRGIRAFKKIREWSEIVAGPRWKTFIRRFNRNKNAGAGNRHGKFQYDPLSYALNFDEGHGVNGDFETEGDYSGYRDFSSRWASVPGAGKGTATTTSSMEVSSKERTAFAWNARLWRCFLVLEGGRVSSSVDLTV